MVSKRENNSCLVTKRGYECVFWIFVVGLGQTFGGFSTMSTELLDLVSYKRILIYYLSQNAILIYNERMVEFWSIKESVTVNLNVWDECVCAARGLQTTLKSFLSQLHRWFAYLKKQFLIQFIFCNKFNSVCNVVQTKYVYLLLPV